MQGSQIILIERPSTHILVLDYCAVSGLHPKSFLFQSWNGSVNQVDLQ
jgi:hypothetical protein